MNRPKVSNIAIEAFYDSFTCAALFRKLRIPGSPTEIMDPRPARAFWIDESQQIVTGLLAKLRAIALLVSVGGVISALGKADRKAPMTESEDIEGLLAQWSSYIKS